MVSESNFCGPLAAHRANFAASLQWAHPHRWLAKIAVIVQPHPSATDHEPCPLPLTTRTGQGCTTCRHLSQLQSPILFFGERDFFHIYDTECILDMGRIKAHGAHGLSCGYCSCWVCSLCSERKLILTWYSRSHSCDYRTLSSVMDRSGEMNFKYCCCRCTVLAGSASAWFVSQRNLGSREKPTTARSHLLFSEASWEWLMQAN